MEGLFADWNFDDDSYLTPNKLSTREEDELMELLWKDGQVVQQSHARREQPAQLIQTHRQETLRKPNGDFLANQETLQKPNNLEDQEVVSWIQYPSQDVVDSFDSDFTSNFLASINNQLHGPEKKHTREDIVLTNNNAQTMAPPKFNSSVSSIGPSHCGSNQSMSNQQVTNTRLSISDGSKNVEERLGNSSGDLSDGNNNKETGSGDRKRKRVMNTDQESMSETGVHMTSTDDQITSNKSNQRSNSTRRNRHAEVHNLSERKRRDRINERLRALQELIPHSSKTDKASILDEAIEYMKSLQMQTQMMYMYIRNGMAAAAAHAYPYMQNPMQLPHQFPAMNRAVAQNLSGLVCQNPVQCQIQAQNQILAQQLASYMGGFTQMQATTTQAAQQPMDMSRFRSPVGQLSQLSAPASSTDSRLHMDK